MSYNAILANARQALAAVGLDDRSDAVAATLSHGEQRQLEIAMSLATDPQVLLLDEPLAGLGTEESLHMVKLIGGLGANHAILLVEHDMDAVFRLAQVLTVMVNGRILASGTPEEIRSNAEVQAAYLGNADEVL
jgi:branched-chain amino acid transport system ATP-binding protein